MNSFRLILFYVFIIFNYGKAAIKVDNPIVMKFNETDNVEFLKNVNFLVGIFDLAVQNDTPTNCVRDMRKILDAIQQKDIWAIKLIDNFGNIPTSFTWGQKFWYSPKSTCTSMNKPIPNSLSSQYNRTMDRNFLNSTSPVNFEFRMLYANYSTPNQVDLKLQIDHILEIGVCVPSSCTNDEIMEYSDKYFNGKTLKPQTFLDIDIKLISIKVPGLSLSFLLTPSVIIYCGVIGTLVFFAVICALYKSYLTWKIDDTTDVKKTTIMETSSIRRFLSCFDVVENLSVICDTEKLAVSVLPGMRTVICFWIIALHVNWHSMFSFNNTLELIATLEKPTSQPIYQAFYFVDVFFIISAFLLIFNFLKNKQRIDDIKNNTIFANIKLFLKLVFCRYLRLAPVFIMTTLLSDIVFTYMDLNTPFYMSPASDLYCKEAWLPNIFLLNNIYGMTNMCVSWGWYVACEMQFYTIFLFILFIYAKCKKTAKFLYILIAIIMLLISYYCYYSNGITFSFDVLFNTSDILYTKPWTRMNSYIGGALMGWIMFKVHKKDIQLNWMFVTGYWISIVIIYILAIFMTIFKTTPIWLVAGIQTFGKMCLGYYVGSVIIMTQIGYGGFLTDLLASKIFVHFSKLTYVIYMCNPILITILYGLRKNSTTYDEISILMDTVSIFIASYLLGLISAVGLELPFIKLANKFIMKK